MMNGRSITSPTGLLAGTRVAAIVAAVGVEAQEHTGTYSQADIQVGVGVYSTTCVTCHGPDGDLVPGVTLRTGPYARASSDDDLKELIRAGIPGTAMPPGEYTEAELTGLVAYLRSMGELDLGDVVVGDADRGRVIYEGKGDCARCHRINGAGSRLGPDLSDVGATRTAGLLERALLDPTGSMFPINRPVRIVTADGTTYQGRRLNEDTQLVAFLVDVFAYDLDFYTDTHKGDSFRMIVEKEYAEDEFLRYRRVLAAEYKGKAGTFHAFLWQPSRSSEARYYDAEGRSVEKTLLKTPLKYARVSSRFNPNRMHPILHKRRGHMGVDYAAPTGTPVWAAADGKIVFRGWRGGAGNCVIVKHEGGLQTVYMHLSKFRKGQKVGQRVKGKTVIGYVGTTGLSTGPHLHFGVKRDGRYVDPLKLKSSRRRGVARGDMKRFKSETRKLVEQLQRIAIDGEPGTDEPSQSQASL